MFVLKPQVYEIQSEMLNDDLMHRQGLKGRTHISFQLTAIWSDSKTD